MNQVEVFETELLEAEIESIKEALDSTLDLSPAYVDGFESALEIIQKVVKEKYAKHYVFDLGSKVIEQRYEL